jgi:hypothetical protein
MEKELIKLLTEYPEDTKSVILNLYNQKYPKTRTKKTIYHFKALGKEYTSDVFVDNYSQFITDTINLCGFDPIQKVIKDCYISRSKENFSEICNNKNQTKEVLSGVYLKTYSPTSVKISHIEKICNELLECKLVKI